MICVTSLSTLQWTILSLPVKYSSLSSDMIVQQKGNNRDIRVEETIIVFKIIL